MTPVDQEFVHDPKNGQHGDCQRAVLASLLDLPIADVPHFAQDDADGKAEFWGAVAEFCRSKGFTFAIFHGQFFWSEDAVYHGITGPSPRGSGVWHTVVGCNGKIVHDPHPDKTGLAGDPSEWKYDFLIRLHKEAA